MAKETTKDKKIVKKETKKPTEVKKIKTSDTKKSASKIEDKKKEIKKSSSNSEENLSKKIKSIKAVETKKSVGVEKEQGKKHNFQDHDSGAVGTLLTKEGFEKLKEELKYLKTGKRKEVSERLKEAISFGDLSENSEYEDAKNEQAFVEGRIVELEKKIKNAKIISDTHAGVISIGSKVEVERIGSNSKEVYSIVGTTEAEPFEGKISNESPLGSALIGLKSGDTATVKAPKGILNYKILKII